MKRRAKGDLPLFRKQQLIDDRSGVPLTVTRWIAPDVSFQLVRRFTAAMDSTRPPERIEPIADSAAFAQALCELVAASGWQDRAGQLQDIEAFLTNNAHLVQRFGYRRRAPNGVVQTFAREAHEWLGRARVHIASTEGEVLAAKAAWMCDSLAHHLLRALDRAGENPRPRPNSQARVLEAAATLRHVAPRDMAALAAKRAGVSVSTARRALHKTK